MVIGHWTHLATLVLVGPCRLGPNCFGPLFLQLCLSFGNRQPCLFGRIERPNASLLPPARTRRHVVDAPLELAAARLAHTARKAAAASLLLGRRSISGRACSSRRQSCSRKAALRRSPSRTSWRDQTLPVRS